MLQKRSFGSVELTSIDEAALRAALRDGVAACAAARPEVEKIVLFGSFARGDWVPESDVDLLVVLSATTIPPLERAENFRSFFDSIPLDVNPLVVTRREFDAASADAATVVHSALAEGEVLFERRV